MFYRKKGIPEENEFVVCTVKKILKHCVFVNLDEYRKVEGMIHISEISPGRIRNIRDFVKPEKKITCKVLRVMTERRNIELSLRRVSLNMRKNKMEEFNQELKAEKILENVGKQLGLSLEEMYKKAGYSLIEKTGLLMKSFREILVNGKDFFKDLEIDDKIVDELITLIKERIKLAEVNIRGILNIKFYSPKGVELVKDIFKETKSIFEKKEYKFKIAYLGAPLYNLDIIASNFKDAEKILEEISKYVVDEVKKNGGEASWERKS